MANGDMIRAGKKLVAALITVAGRDDACRLEKSAGRDGAPDPGRTFSIQASATGRAPASHYLMIDWMEADRRAEWEAYPAGTVPQRTRDRYSENGLNSARGTAAAMSMTLDVADPDDDWEQQPDSHLASVLRAQGLKIIEDSP